jgi:hypothetical protein
MQTSGRDEQREADRVLARPTWSDDGIVLLVDHATPLEADGRLVEIARLTPSRRRAIRRVGQRGRDDRR